MSNFTVRIELYEPPKASGDDYANLHAEMSKEGFSRIINKDGKSFHLPTAEYSQIGVFKKVDILEKAKRAAFNCWKNFGVLVTEDESPREIFNLKPVVKVNY